MYLVIITIIAFDLFIIIIVIATVVIVIFVVVLGFAVIIHSLNPNHQLNPSIFNLTYTSIFNPIFANLILIPPQKYAMYYSLPRSLPYYSYEVLNLHHHYQINMQVPLHSHTTFCDSKRMMNGCCFVSSQ